MASSILAYDLGTTAIKATLFSDRGIPRASASAAYETVYPRPGWAEQRPSEWWDAACLVTRELLRGEGAKGWDIAAIGFSGHMMGCLAVDGSGVPLASSLIHSDGRSEVQCDRLRERFGNEFLYRITGNRIAPQYTLPKMMWLKENHPEVLSRAAWFLQAKDYLAFRFTDRLGVTDFSDASLAGLLDLEKKTYAHELIEAAGISSGLLPEVLPSATVIGTVTREAAERTGLKQGIPVVIGGGDGACATVGAGALAPGEGYLYGGGTSWISMVADRPLIDPKMRVFNLLDLDPRKANVLGTMQCAGSSFEWFANRVCGPDGNGNRFEELGEAAREIPAGSERLFFLPYLMGERAPIWDSLARGVFFGLSLSHGRAHLARAVLEGVAYSLRSIAEVLEELGGRLSSPAFIGGLSKSAIFREILATVLNRSLALPANPGEATSRGAAIAAAVAVGILRDYQDARGWIPVENSVSPVAELVSRYNAYYGFHQGLYPALKEKFREADRLP